MNKKTKLGATIGRYIGRILNARFTLDSVIYQLKANTGAHCAHGGEPGFASRIWQADRLDNNSLKLSYFSPDGENGFWNLTVDVYFTVTDKEWIRHTHEATTDKPTVLNLSNHSFFNISEISAIRSRTKSWWLMPIVTLLRFNQMCDGRDTAGDCYTVRLQITPLRWRQHWCWLFAAECYRRLTHVGAQYARRRYPFGSPHNRWCKRPHHGSLHHRTRIANLYGQWFEKEYNRQKQTVYGKRCSICFETQHFADGPNKPQFPSTVLRPGERYRSHTVYRFGVIPINRFNWYFLYSREFLFLPIRVSAEVTK